MLLAGALACAACTPGPEPGRPLFPSGAVDAAMGGEGGGSEDAGVFADAGLAPRDAEVGDASTSDVGGVDLGTDAGAVGASDGGSPVPRVACSVVVTTELELESALANVRAGTTVCLEARVWRDLRLEVAAEGLAEAPVVVAAERPGATVLTGAMSLALGGRHVVVTGLVLRDGASAGSHLIDFRAGGRECHGCRISNLAVVELEDEGDTKWVSLRGEGNRVDHSVFYGKANDGALLVVWRPDDGPDRHRIDHNLFAERPPLGRNGGETIRVGTSAHAQSSSFTAVEDNYFYRSDGEIEIISNKSGHNIYRRNVFQRSAGLLTLRHGNDCIVEQNVFLTEGVSGGGGIRVVGARHRIANNYVEGCRTGSNVRGGLVLMAADVDPAPNGYQRVEDVDLVHNTIVDCQQSLLVGGGSGSVSPRRIRVAANLFAPLGAGDVARVVLSVEPATYQSNLYFGGELRLPEAGFTEADPQLRRGAGGLLRPAVEGPVQGAAPVGLVAVDLDDDPRGGAPDIGADELGVGPSRLPIERSAVGPTFSVAR